MTIYGTHIEVVQTRVGSDIPSQYLVDAEAASPTEHNLRVKSKAALPIRDRFRELTREVQGRPNFQSAKDKEAIARVEALVSRSRFPYQIREEAWLVKPSAKIPPTELLTIQKVQVQVDQAAQAECHGPIVLNREKKIIPIVAPVPRRETQSSEPDRKFEKADLPTQARKLGKQAVPIVAQTLEREAQSSKSSNSSQMSEPKDRSVWTKKAGKKAIAIVRPTPEWEAQEAERKAKAEDSRQTLTAVVSRASGPNMESTPDLAEPVVRTRTKSAPAELTWPSHGMFSPRPSITPPSPSSTMVIIKFADGSDSSQGPASQIKRALVHPLPKPVFHPSLWPGRKDGTRNR